MGKRYMCVRRNNVVLIRKFYIFLMFKLSFKNLLWNWKMCDKWYKLLYACMNACFKINAWESCKMHDTWQACVLLRAFHSGRDMGGGLPPLHVFFNSPPPSKPMPYHGAPHLQMKPPLKSKSLFWEMILRKKKQKKMEAVINTCV